MNSSIPIKFFLMKSINFELKMHKLCTCKNCTLFLNQNDVFLKSSGFNMKIGEASNLNMVHFSTNIGLGLKYSFLKKFDARIEPLFKYQLNTFSSGSGNFKPYIFGVYSGISYHF